MGVILSVFLFLMFDAEYFLAHSTLQNLLDLEKNFSFTPKKPQNSQVPVHSTKKETCCDFLFLMHVNEQMSYECSEYMCPHLNIHNVSTRSHLSEEENRTLDRSKNCKCQRALKVNTRTSQNLNHPTGHACTNIAK